MTNQINNISTISESTNKAQGKNSAKSTDASFTNTLEKSTKGTTNLEDIFQRAADKYNVPVKLLKAIAKAESNFNPNVVSHCGAQGIMQLMPKTAASLGVSDPFDPEQNIMGGAKYISQKIQQYNGDITLALAAYNAGSGNVAKYGGVPPFKETQNYIQKISQYMGENLSAISPVATKTTKATKSVTSSANIVAQQKYSLGNLNLTSVLSGDDFLTNLSDNPEKLGILAIAKYLDSLNKEDDDDNSLFDKALKI